MILYHLEKRKYQDVWPPEGTLHAEGRWNKAGQWVIYASPSIALAKLEILANEEHLPIQRVCMAIEISEGYSVFDVESDALPIGWPSTPYPVNLLAVTSEFLKSKCLLMKIPSAQSMREFNYVINVRHPDFHSTVKLVDVRPEPFDGRLG